MSLIATHHNRLVKESMTSPLIEENLFTLATQVTYQLVQQHPGLIADVESGAISDSILKSEIIQLVDALNTYYERDELIKHVMNYMFGYGILQELIEDETISDIDVPRFNFFMIKRNGKKELAPISFNNEEEFERFCKLVIIRNGGLINESDAHARVSDEYYRLRINVTIPPRSATGPSLCIRKHRKESYDLNELQSIGMLTEEMNDFFSTMMTNSSRFIISGKGASGKTTLLRALLEKIEITERILVCEKDMELHLDGLNFIVQRIKKGGAGSENALKELMADGLTMSLDGYCIGELIGDEAWEFVKAGHTDHRVFGTIHGNGAFDVVQRLLMLIEPVTRLSEQKIERLVYESIDYIIHLEGFKVVSINQLHVEGERQWVKQIM